ncbi:hypothetical protein Pmar_PMAR010013 [Perkinsus marinus ATCC 50983]|uniref:DUF4371 domain-containing protein n=1 Tax=Perkinsus marinus (strain ATCC 50983 / TXsc) TaxID=423536 RepID=C5K5J0_PERM5|nr:hypothetical protein Pmar_PMAR010013 [Perkinsus marinus ATCC 50983]EER20252.1 hypothetical protein Pmar_PMAR010013 [Perkinsus marinus ATCC 50983]|eukprot:XP_002788456.1 hypothetical protein Pmar_PMAR010013 [Perkinsus marinus ATCC 50983]
MVPQTFDGASAFQGSIAGARKLINDHFHTECPVLHCRSHSLQLACSFAAEESGLVSRLLSLVTTIYTFHGWSPKRYRHLRAAAEQIDMRAKKLINPSTTRWLSFDGSVSAVLSDLEALIESTYELGEDDGAGHHIFLHLTAAGTLKSLFLLDNVLGELSSLCRGLQREDLSLLHSVGIIQQSLERLGNIPDLEQLVNEKNAAIEALGHEVSENLPTKTNRRQNRDVRGLVGEIMEYILSLRETMKKRLLDDIDPVIFLYRAFSLDKSLRDPDFDFTEIGQFVGMSAKEVNNLGHRWRAQCAAHWPETLTLIHSRWY